MINRRSWLTYGALTLCLVAFFLLTIPTGDDWGRIAYVEQIKSGHTSLIERLNLFYVGTNGRVLGNSLHLLASFSFVLNAIARSLVIVGIVWCIFRIAQLKAMPLLAVLTLLVLVPSVAILSQAIVWSAGFYNYTVPVLLVLALYVILRDSSSRWSSLAVFLLAIAACLFVETVTVGLLLTSLAILVVLITKRMLTLPYIALAIGAIAGTLLMFASPAYRNIAAGTDAYREVPAVGEGFVNSLISRIADNLPSLVQYVALDLSVFYLAVATGIIVFARSSRASFWLGVLGGSAAALFLLSQVRFRLLEGRAEVLVAAAILALFVTFIVSACTVVLRSDDPVHRTAAPWLAASAAIIAPFAVVTPFGARNFYASAVFMIVAITIVSASRLNTVSWTTQRITAVTVGWCMAAAPLVGVLGVNKIVDLQNRATATAAYQSGAEEITLKAYPFPLLAQNGNSGKKFLHSLQALECRDGACVPMRDVNVSFE
ncbi:DUF6056 family protein [Leucobacter sp. NPDC077196]|uniref:DUF6056 family protein n=1 Tax=Leucobacter sp. NPDC077196 TaxID=3154959 RepID=UPI003414A667